MYVKVLNILDESYDSFVHQYPEHKLCHLPAWSEMITQWIGHTPFYLVAVENSKIVGILPLTLIRSRLFGIRMISQAFHTYGGPLVKSESALNVLYDYAVGLANEHRCGMIEFRNIEAMPYKLHLRTDKVAMHLRLRSDPDELWEGFKGEIRNRVRKAEKNGLVIIKGRMGLLDDFYKIWTIRMRELGTPAYPRSLMRGILETFPENSWIFLVRLNDSTIGGAFTTNYNGFADMQWVATLIKFNNLASNMLLHWSIIKHHCLQGASCFDFGRCSIDGPTYEFKKRWGAEPVRLNYQYWTKPSTELSLAVPGSPRYRRKVAVWKKLPLFVTRLVGPYLSRNLP